MTSRSSAVDRSLVRELAYYESQTPEWHTAHRGEFVVIKGEKALGFFWSEDEALSAGAAACGLTSFLVRRVGNEILTVSIPRLTL